MTFDRSDFTGGSGPGLAKLRAAAKAAGVKPEALIIKDKLELTGRGKRKMIEHHMRGGEWKEAILLASKLPADAFGDNAAAIHRGREAILRPDFQRQLRRDPDQMIEEAKKALLEELPL